MKNKSVFQQNLRDALKKSQDDDAKDVAETLLLFRIGRMVDKEVEYEKEPIGG